MSFGTGARARTAAKQRIGFALRAFLSVGLLGLLLLVLPWDQITAAASRMTLSIYLGALAAFVAGHVLGVVKWRILLAASLGGQGLPMRDALEFYGAGLFSNLFLPSVVGGDVVRAGLAARSLGRMEAVVLGGIADRLIDLASLALLILLGAVLAGAQVAGWAGPLAGLFLVIVLGGTVLVSPLALQKARVRRLRRFKRPIGRALVALRHLGRRPLPALVALSLSLAMQSAFVLIGAWLGSTVGASASLWVWFFVWPLAKTVGMLPVSLGGFGVRDAALAALLVPFGVPAAVGLVTAMAWNAMIISGALVGGVLAWLLRLRTASRSDGTPSSPHIPVSPP